MSKGMWFLAGSVLLVIGALVVSGLQAPEQICGGPATQACVDHSYSDLNAGFFMFLLIGAAALVGISAVQFIFKKS